MNDLFRLDGQTAAVVGATGVLGGAMASALAAAGARVAVLGRNAERGGERVDAIQASGGEAAFFVADATDAESLAKAAEAITVRWEAPSILINAAGGNHPDATLKPGDDFCNLSREAWAQVFDLNLVGGALLPCQIFGKAMVESGTGSVINIASLSGITPLSRVIAYSAAKGAVLNFTQFLAREWAEQGVRVNALSPGFFPAEQNRKLLMNDDGSYTDRGNQIIQHTPMRRFGRAEELAGAVVWLASGASSFVTGQNIVVDGGFSSTTI